MKTKKLFRSKEKYYKYINKLRSTKENLQANSIYEKILKIIKRFKKFEKEGNVEIKPSVYELKQHFVKEKNRLNNSE